MQSLEKATARSVGCALLPPMPRSSLRARLCRLGMAMRKIPQRHGKKCIDFLETYVNWNHLPTRSAEFGFLT